MDEGRESLRGASGRAFGQGATAGCGPAAEGEDSVAEAAELVEAIGPEPPA